MAFAVDSTTHTAKYYDRHANGTAIEAPPVGMLLHHGGGSITSDLHILTGNDPKRKVGCHYYVTKSGIIYRLCPDTYAPWHAGAMDYATKRWWGGNAASFGIVNGNRLLGVETEHRQGDDWPGPQMDALDWLCRQAIAAYGFGLQRLGAHKWFAPHRKIDPADWPDADMQAWFRSLYGADGGWYEVTEPRGARIRQGPGTSFPIAETLPVGYRFWSDGTIIGEAVEGNNVWVHFAGSTPTLPNPLGFVSMAILQEVTP